jgi:hypothetical protein
MLMTDEVPPHYRTGLAVCITAVKLSDMTCVDNVFYTAGFRVAGLVSL